MVVPCMRETSAHQAKKRLKENIRRDCECKKAELQSAVQPGLFRSFKFYFGAIALLAVLGGSLFEATSRAVSRRVESPVMRALRHLDTLAVALGRYRFHTGQFPTAEQGLAALVRDPGVPAWNGPYLSLLKRDPWGSPFVYAPADGRAPDVFSCGPDRKQGTPDDLRPDPARFDPGTEWTNGWVSAELRLPGVWVLPPDGAAPNANP
jgi:general secretion pathway protein G